MAPEIEECLEGTPEIRLGRRGVSGIRFELFQGFERKRAEVRQHLADPRGPLGHELLAEFAWRHLAPSVRMSRTLSRWNGARSAARRRT
jgi:hypothetical protein